MAKILIVEDEKPINNLIRKNLETVGHECVCVYDGQAAVDELDNQSFDLVLLDIMLPKADGFQIIKDIVGTPVIYLTARASVDDRVRGLRLGADDYITKPFHVIELQARVESVLRRTQKAEQAFTLGDVTVDLSSRLVYLDGGLVEFTPQEFALIEALILNRNIALSRDKLLEIAWGFEYGGDTRTVDAHISRIRKKLKWESVINTVYKLGYRLQVI